MKLTVNPINKIQGEVRVPGDKSVSHRALILSSLANGQTIVNNFLEASDTLSTLSCLKSLGVQAYFEHGRLIINGVGKTGFIKSKKLLDAGNSGTTMRILPAILAAQSFTSSITGDDSLRKRPMDRVIKPLSLMGADISSKNGYAPLEINGTQLKGITYELPVASAQVKSAVLIAGLLAKGQTTVIEPQKSRDHTERMLNYLGAAITSENNEIRIKGQTQLTGLPIEIPGDLSSAAFFIAASLIVPDSKLTVVGTGVNPTRTGFLQVIKRMGASISLENEALKNNEPIADIVTKTSSLSAIEISKDIIPLAIDEIPILAVLATQAEGTTIIKDAAELKLKETDRITAIAAELKKMNANIEATNDGLIINGPTKLKGAVVESYGDHRMAMSLAIAGLVASGQTTIQGSECINISFPRFYELLKVLI
ncbi:MAG: 3-phosphoshikimate 1-carboxyvinyltransferase [Actinobacteria bacterium]|nr:MAG: 3-phosphoshikimate 1-carboxyvinyltransferase [Actinomycetota bacterium]